MSLGAARTSGERSLAGTSLAPLTTASGSKFAECLASASESVVWLAVAMGWLVESACATKARASRLFTASYGRGSAATHVFATRIWLSYLGGIPGMGAV